MGMCQYDVNEQEDTPCLHDMNVAVCANIDLMLTELYSLGEENDRGDKSNRTGNIDTIDNLNNQITDLTRKLDAEILMQNCCPREFTL